MQRKPQILICDDDSLYHLALKTALKSEYDCKSAYNTDEAIAILKNQVIDVLLLDVQIRTPEEGLEAIPKILDLDPELPVVMISGNIGFETVKQALLLGAIDYIAKDFNPEDLTHVLRRVRERKSLIIQRDQRDFEVQAEQKKHTMVGNSAPIREVRRLIDKFRGSKANVLIHGETGSGKEVIARLLRGKKADGSLEPFVAVDSSTIQSSTAESMLFGHEKGAFTGADRVNKGLFEEANEGIIYFDEIANMPMDIQVKLLRVLQEKEITRLGSTKSLSLEFRVICASNQNLDEMVAQGRFKEDLLQRLNVLPIQIPPLRERREDISLLVAHFLSQQQTARPGLNISNEALELLSKYRWPGNVRELVNVIAFTAAMAETTSIEIADLPPKLRDLTRPNQNSGSNTAASGFYEQVAAFEKGILADAYARHDGNVSKLALSLGMDRSHLYTKLREYGIHQGKIKRNPET